MSSKAGLSQMGAEESKERELQVHLEEYRNLQVEGIERSKLQNLIIGSVFALISVGLALSRVLSTTNERRLLLLATPMVSVVAGLLYLDQSEHIIAKDEYVDSDLRPRILAAIGSEDSEIRIFTQREWRSRVRPSARNLMRGLAWVRLGTVASPGLAVTVIAIVSWIGSGSTRRTTSSSDYALFAADCAALILLALVAYWVSSVHYLGPRRQGMAVSQVGTNDESVESDDPTTRSDQVG